MDIRKKKAKATWFEQKGVQMKVDKNTEALPIGEAEDPRLDTYEPETAETEERRGKDESRLSKDEYRLLIENAIEGIFIAQDGWLKYVNPRVEKITQYTSEELLSKPFLEFLYPDDQEMVADNHEKRMRGEFVPDIYEFRIIEKKGKVRWIELGSIRIKWRGRPATLNFMMDTTKRKNAEESLKKSEIQLLQAQKMEAIGGLAAGIAHEINTPIQYIGDNTRFLKDAFRDIESLTKEYVKLLNAVKNGVVTDELIGESGAAISKVDLDYLAEEIPLAIEQSLDGIERVANIVRAMKDFAHPDLGEKVESDINRAIESTILVSRNEWKYVAEVETDFDPDLPLIPCLPGEFNQVILNIIINAAHAIDDVSEGKNEVKGKIKISTRQCSDVAEIRISDTGAGIPEEIRTRIFDPFFTTKEVGKGTGQGLAIAHSVVVEKHGGTISFESKIGEGTTITIHLPIRDANV